MGEATRRCTACCICGAPRSAPWHSDGAMTEASYAYVPCDVTLVRQRPGRDYRHDGPCKGVDHAPFSEELETLEAVAGD